MQMSAVNLIKQTVDRSLHWNNEDSERKKNIYTEKLLFVIRMSTQTNSHIWSTDHAYRINSEFIQKSQLNLDEWFN